MISLYYVFVEKNDKHHTHSHRKQKTSLLSKKKLRCYRTCLKRRNYATVQNLNLKKFKFRWA